MLYARLWLAGLALMLANVATAQDALPLSPTSMTEPGTASATDPCRLRLAPAPLIQYRGALSRGYDGDSNRVHTELGALTVEHSGEACAYIVRIEPDAGPGKATLHSGSDTLDVRIDQAGREISSGDNVVEVHGSMPRGQPQRQIKFQVTLPPGQRVRAGQYTGRLAVSLFESRDGGQELVTQQTVDVVTQVAPSVVASFGSDAQGGIKSMDMDFGTLMKGQEKSLDFSVAANTPYSIDLLSENAGELRHEFTPYGIAYDLRIDGQLVQPAAGTETTILQGHTSSQHRLDFMIRTETALALAGKYSDRLTLIIAAD
tara:strand:- start:832 stop:1779 length:948 start_codon:yes stop_codon:yes gene_type:complete